MLINKTGAEFQYNGMAFKIGEKIIANSQSEYSGLIGHILEIRDGEDKETENETPDIYCEFDVPSLPYDVKALESYFSELYGETKKVDDIPLDCVIMAPEMIDVLDAVNSRRFQVYLVHEEWVVKGEQSFTVEIFTDYQMAKACLNEKLQEELTQGPAHSWQEKDEFEVDSGSYFFKCWLDGEYCENHYKIAICQDSVQMSEVQFGTLGRIYLDECRTEDFRSQVKEWDKIADLSEEDYQKFISDPSIPERVHKALGGNDSYWESYWESVSEVAHELLAQYLKQQRAVNGGV